MKSPSLGTFKTGFPKQPDLTFKLTLLGVEDPTPDDPQSSFQPQVFCRAAEYLNHGGWECVTWAADKHP